MTKPHLLMTGPMMPLIAEGVAKSFVVHDLGPMAGRAALLAKIAPDVVAIATGSHTGVKTDAALMALLPKLRVIGNFGVGYDSIDIAAAARAKIIVTNTPDVLNEEVADTAFGLMLMTVRELGQAEAYLRAGRWAAEGDYRLTQSLRDRRLGIVGLGRIGKAIARRAEAFGMPIAYLGRSKQAGVAYPYYSDLAELARAVDILLLIAPGGAATQGMVGATVLAALGAKGILINVARGTVVDEPALIAALKARTILAAGLDVYIGEPNINPELLALDNVTLLPHLGSASVWTRNRMGQLVVDNLAAFAQGAVPPTPVPETPFVTW